MNRALLFSWIRDSLDIINKSWYETILYSIRCVMFTGIWQTLSKRSFLLLVYTVGGTASVLIYIMANYSASLISLKLGERSHNNIQVLRLCLYGLRCFSKHQQKSAVTRCLQETTLRWLMHVINASIILWALLTFQCEWMVSDIIYHIYNV